jgi:hypothetical protein
MRTKHLFIIENQWNKKPTVLLFFLLIPFFINNCTSKDNEIPIRRSYFAKILFIRPSAKSTITKEEDNDIKSLKNSIAITSFSMTEAYAGHLDAVQWENFNIIVIPFASAKSLNYEEVNSIKRAVHSGANLIFDGVTSLKDIFDITVNKSAVTVTKVHDLTFTENKLYWTSPCDVTPIDTLRNKHKVLCVDDSTHSPLALYGKFGQGKFIYFAPLFDPVTDKGYSRFPFLIETIGLAFEIKPITERRAAEMYFDPGERPDSSNVDTLAKWWKTCKVKRIFAAGWYYDSDYNYAALLKACHENGILVYCWLETPMISTNFWNKHPEWREKTVFQKDAHIDWRYLMNLADENCRRQVCKETGEFLMKYDWDGVDFAELYFEPSPVGPELPENFTPMNKVVREEFKKKGGFDPVLLFDTANVHYWKTHETDWKKFALYRKDLCFRLKKYFLDYFSTIKTRKNDFEVMLTVLDVSITPELSDFIGEDTQNTLSLFKQYDITLQIEDPSNCWGLTPERYRNIGELYRKNVKEKNKLVFDCNVVSAHEKGYGGFPLEIPSGEEIRQIAYNMDLHDIRPAFYSENVVSASDYKNISTTLARKAKVIVKAKNKWEINTPFTIRIHPENKNTNVALDNQTWLAGEDDEIIIPQGKHVIEFKSPEETFQHMIRLKNISGELKSAKFFDHRTELIYSEDITSCYVTIDQQPATIYIDDKQADCPIFKNKEEITIKLPQGEHRVVIKN